MFTFEPSSIDGLTDAKLLRLLSRTERDYLYFVAFGDHHTRRDNDTIAANECGGRTIQRIGPAASR